MEIGDLGDLSSADYTDYAERNRIKSYNGFYSQGNSQCIK